MNIPDRWLQGATQRLQRDYGMTFKQAYLAAVNEWREQEEMEAGRS